MLSLALLSLLHAEPTPPPVIDLKTPNPTTVHFLAYDGADAYTVSVGAHECVTPCTLELDPGPTKVTTTGAGDIEAQMVIPHLTAQVRLSHGAPRWYTTVGAIMVPAGLVIGASMWSIAFACGFGPSSGACIAANAIAWPVFGVSMFVTGIVLLALGSKSPPADANRPEILDARRSTRVRFEGLALAPGPRGLTGALGFSF